MAFNEELDKLGRDKMFYRICFIDRPFRETKEDILRDMKKITNPNFQDNEGTSYLHMACQVHSLEAIRILLELGADPNLDDNYMSCPVSRALGRKNNNNKDLLKLLLEYGLDLNKTEGSQTLKEWIKMLSGDEFNELIG